MRPSRVLTDGFILWRKTSEIPRHRKKTRILEGNLMEARVGIEPTYKGFADLSLTTWVPRL